MAPSSVGQATTRATAAQNRRLETSSEPARPRTTAPPATAAASGLEGDQRAWCRSAPSGGSARRPSGRGRGAGSGRERGTRAPGQRDRPVAHMSLIKKHDVPPETVTLRSRRATRLIRSHSCELAVRAGGRSDLGATFTESHERVNTERSPFTRWGRRTSARVTAGGSAPQVRGWTSFWAASRPRAEERLGGVGGLGDQQVELLALGRREVLEDEVGGVLAARAAGRCRRARAGSPSCPVERVIERSPLCPPSPPPRLRRTAEKGMSSSSWTTTRSSAGRWW